MDDYKHIDPARDGQNLRNFWRALGREPQHVVGHTITTLTMLSQCIRDGGEPSEFVKEFLADFERWSNFTGSDPHLQEPTNG